MISSPTKSHAPYTSPPACQYALIAALRPLYRLIVTFSLAIYPQNAFSSPAANSRLETEISGDRDSLRSFVLRAGVMGACQAIAQIPSAPVSAIAKRPWFQRNVR